MGVSMDQFEKVEKLREKANVSYEEAKEALESNEWDMLDAMVYLEKLGKVNGPKTTSYTTNGEDNSDTQNSTSYSSNDTSFGEIIGNFFRWCGKVIKKGNENSFQIERSNEKPVCIPVTVFILFVLFIFWVTIPLLVIGLFFGFKYSFKGPDVDRKPVNDFMDKASETAENIKNDFKSSANK